MDFSKLQSYRKSDTQQRSIKPIRIVSHQNKAVLEIEENPEEDNNSMLGPASYKKADGIRSTNLVFVLSGGEKKEKDFLYELIRRREKEKEQKRIERQKRSNRYDEETEVFLNEINKYIKVKFQSKDGQGLQPYQMLEEWKKIYKSKILLIDSIPYNLEGIDKVFLLTDVDEFKAQLINIIHSKHKKQEHWIISNPCFEMWLYYCFRNNPKEDLILDDLSEDKRSKQLKKRLGEIFSGGVDPRKIFTPKILNTGIKNSRQHYTFDNNLIPELYATQMYEMAEYFIRTLEKKQEEQKKLLENQKNEIEDFKKEFISK